ncbi:MAG: WYL domain-containing protein [Anaerolineae bacterium]|nr:WYL domain-containing protein [Anaerolineae bacterium]
MHNTVLPSPPRLLHDAARCLALAHQHRLGVTRLGRLEPNSLQRLAAYTQPDDAAYVRFLFDLLVEAGLLRLADGHAQPTDAAYRWLAQPAALQILALRRAWFDSLHLTWQWLPADRAVVLPAVQWPALLLAALAALAAPEADLTADDLLQRLERQGLLVPRGRAQNLPRLRQSAAGRVGRVLAFLLRAVLPGLALVETVSPVGQAGVRPTAEGSAWLRHALADRPGLALDPPYAEELALPDTPLAFAPVAAAAVTMTAERGVLITPTAPARCVFDVTLFARLRSPDPPARYELTPAAFQAALSRGGDAAGLLFKLTVYSGGDLPPGLADTVRAWQDKTARITWTPGYRLTPAHPTSLDQPRQRRAFRERTERLGAQDAWVAQADAPSLFRYLRRLGYTVAPATAGPGAETAPLPPATLPLTELLVVLRTYEAVARRVPGLAQLTLADVDRAVAEALAADDLAGVARLVASHTALLAQQLPAPHLPPDPSSPPSLRGKGDGGLGSPAPRPPLPLGEASGVRAVLAAAIAAQTPVHLVYVDTRARVTRRQVRPQRLVRRWGRDYLIARCELRGDERAFRLDRVVTLSTK